MINWRTTSLSDLETLQKYALSNNFFANNYGAVNSVLYEKKFRSQIAVENSWLFEKFYEGQKLCYAFPHSLTGESENIKSALLLLIDDVKNAALHENNKLIFENILSEEKDILLNHFPLAKVTATPESGDYIYWTENLSVLAGKKLSRKRNHIHQFENKYPDFTFELLSEDNFSAVLEIEEKWLKENAAQSLTDLQIEKEIIFNALDNFDAFSKTCGMTGGVLFASGDPVAFCIASLLSQNVTDIHFEKCIPPFDRDGGYAVINNAFSKTIKTEFINREEDLGIEGLRKAKLSYYPERVLEKYSVEIKL